MNMGADTHRGQREDDLLQWELRQCDPPKHEC